MIRCLANVDLLPCVARILHLFSLTCAVSVSEEAEVHSLRGSAAGMCGLCGWWSSFHWLLRQSSATACCEEMCRVSEAPGVVPQILQIPPDRNFTLAVWQQRTQTDKHKNQGSLKLWGDVYSLIFFNLYYSVRNFLTFYTFFFLVLSCCNMQKKFCYSLIG